LTTSTLDAYDGNTLWTRQPDLGWQVWQFTRVGETLAGTGICTIAPACPPCPQNFKSLCLTATTMGGAVQLGDYVSGNLAQRWLIDTAAEHTTIVSAKYMDFVMQGNGLDTAVTLTAVDTHRRTISSGPFQRGDPGSTL